MNITRTPFVLVFLYYFNDFPFEFLIMGYTLLSCIFLEADSRIFFFFIPVIWLTVVVVSMIVRLSPRRKEPRYFDFREISKFDLHAHQYADGTGDPCIRISTTIDSFSTITLKDEVKTVEFRIYSFPDFEKYFDDIENALGRILRSIPLYKSSATISVGESLTQWSIPRRYRTRWGVVEVV